MIARLTHCNPPTSYVLQTYTEMAVAAIKALKDRTGSSPAAIKKYIIANNSGLNYLQHALKAGLKTGVTSGLLLPVKGSYKLTVSAPCCVRARFLFLNFDTCPKPPPTSHAPLAA